MAKSNKLTDEQVVEIRCRYFEGDVSQQSLSDEFGVSRQTISSIVRGETYADVGGPTQTDNHGLPDSTVQKIREQYHNGADVDDFVDRLDVSRSHIQDILLGEVYSDVPGPTVSTMNRKLHDNQVNELRRRVRDGEKVVDFYDEFRVSYKTATGAIKGKGVYADVGAEPPVSTLSVKYTDAQVRKVKRLVSEGSSFAEAARAVGASSGWVRLVVGGEIRADVTIDDKAAE